MDLMPYTYPGASWDTTDPYGRQVGYPNQYGGQVGWPTQESTLGFPSDFGDAFAMIPANMRQDPLMKKTIRNAKRIVRPLKGVLRADVIDKENHYEVHAGIS